VHSLKLAKAIDYFDPLVIWEAWKEAEKKRQNDND